MADTAKRVGGPTALTTSAATQYTVPALTTTILRSIHVANEDSSARTFTLSIGTDGAGKRLWKDVTVPVGGSFDWSGFIVLAAGEVIQALASANTALTLVLSGVEST